MSDIEVQQTNLEHEILERLDQYASSFPKSRGETNTEDRRLFRGVLSRGIFNRLTAPEHVSSNPVDLRAMRNKLEQALLKKLNEAEVDKAPEVAAAEAQIVFDLIMMDMQNALKEKQRASLTAEIIKRGGMGKKILRFLGLEE